MATNQVTLARTWRQQDFPPDTLRRFLKHPDLPDTMRVFYLNRLAAHIGASDLTAAVGLAEQAVNLAHKIHYVKGELNCLRVLGNTRTEMGDYVSAMRAYQRALRLATKLDLKRPLVPLYLCMGSTASILGDNKRSLEYLLKGQQILQELSPNMPPESRDDYALSYTALGNTYFQLKDFTQARAYAKRALALFGHEDDSNGAVQANLLMGRIYQADLPHTTARLDSAGHYLQAAVYMAASKENEKEVAGNLLSLAELYQQQGKYQQMLQVARRSLKMARKVGSIPFEQEAAELASKASAALGNFREAYAFHVESAGLNNIVLNIEKTKAIEQLQMEYGMQDKIRRIDLLTQRERANKAAASHQLRWQWTLVGITCTLAIGLLVGSVLHLRLQKSQRELAAANEEISETAAEKEVLIQEIHHRVKNNLQLISSLLGWQKESTPDPVLVQVLSGNQARIQSMAMVHEFLYQADNLASVRLDDYLQALLNSLHASLAKPSMHLHLRLGPLLMDAKEAGYLGLLVNETVTNAYKHAFTEQESGNLTVELVTTEEHGFFLSITDDGKGLPPTGFVSRPDSIGIQLVKTLTRQLKAKISVLPQRVGTRIEITRLT